MDVRAFSSRCGGSTLWSLKLGTSINRQDLMYEIMRKQTAVVNLGTEVVFLWVPAQKDIVGIE